MNVIYIGISSQYCLRLYIDFSNVISKYLSESRELNFSQISFRNRAKLRASIKGSMVAVVNMSIQMGCSSRLRLKTDLVVKFVFRTKLEIIYEHICCVFQKCRRHLLPIYLDFRLFCIVFLLFLFVYITLCFFLLVLRFCFVFFFPFFFLYLFFFCIVILSGLIFTVCCLVFVFFSFASSSLLDNDDRYCVVHEKNGTIVSCYCSMWYMCLVHL